jgi:hypothetical protein
MARGALNLLGHSHGTLKPQPRQIDVGVDVWGFRPATVATLKARQECFMLLIFPYNVYIPAHDEAGCFTFERNGSANRYFILCTVAMR